MDLNPSFYIADIQTGVLYGGKIPFDAVKIESSLQPGWFSATLDLRKYGHHEGRSRSEVMEDGRALVQLLRNGKCTLVPIIEGPAPIPGGTPTYTTMGEWWVSDVRGTHQSPVITLQGPEFAGYVKELLLVEDIVGTLDPVQQTRRLLGLAFTYSQSIRVELGTWLSETGAQVPIDLREASVDYWSAIADLQDNPLGPFEWRIRAGLDVNADGARRATRYLEVGQPVLSTPRPDVTLNLRAPGETPGSVVDREWSLSESRNATDVNGFGAGAGADQVGPVHESRPREPGEPGKARLVVDRSATKPEQLRRPVLSALRSMTPADQVFSAELLAEIHLPRLGEVYTWRQAASWAFPASAGSARVSGWSWDSGAPDRFGLSLTRV